MGERFCEIIISNNSKNFYKGQGTQTLNVSCNVDGIVKVNGRALPDTVDVSIVVAKDGSKLRKIAQVKPVPGTMGKRGTWKIDPPFDVLASQVTAATDSDCLPDSKKLKFCFITITSSKNLGKNGFKIRGKVTVQDQKLPKSVNIAITTSKNVILLQDNFPVEPVSGTMGTVGIWAADFSMQKNSAAKVFATAQNCQGAEKIF